MDQGPAVRPGRLARKAADVLDLDRLMEEVEELALGWNLRVVPVTPVSTAGSCQLVLLGSDHLNAAEFCELAASSGALLLYAQAESFDAGTDLDLNHWAWSRDQRDSARDVLAELHRDAQRHNSRVRQLELSFAAGCVLHCWAVAASWYTNLLDRAAALLPPAP
jgi:hypothetical protein